MKDYFMVFEINLDGPKIIAEKVTKAQAQKVYADTREYNQKLMATGVDINTCLYMVHVKDMTDICGGPSGAKFRA